MKKIALKIKFLIFFCTLSIICTTIFGFSLHMLHKLVYNRDNIFYGKRQSDLAKEIREELFKSNNIQRVKIKSSDNLTLSGILIKKPNPKANLLLCHGYRGGKEFMYGFIDMFPHFNILLFDFRAHGQSEGQLTSIGCHEYKDVIAAAKFMEESTKKDPHQSSPPLIILGISMGAASAIKAASVKPDLCRALIIDSTFSDLKKILIKGFSVKSGLPFYPFFPIIRWLFENAAQCDICEMSTAKYIKKVIQPILFIHSCNDALISPKHSLRLYENAEIAKFTKIWIGPKCRHGWLHSYYTDLYKKKATNFLYKILNPTLT